ncbi:hypothetical protein F2P79_002754 [Pimephales promelas]|nr:hypothetical protein F2P79_002754 [Pimephales promelas]
MIEGESHEDQRTGSLILHNLPDALLPPTHVKRLMSSVRQCAACSITLRVTYAGRSGAVIGGVLMGTFLVLLLIGTMIVSYITWNSEKHI